MNHQNVKGATLTYHLVFCPDCRQSNTWVRHPVKDMVYESGRIYEYAYICQNCGAITWYPKEAVLHATNNGD